MAPPTGVPDGPSPRHVILIEADGLPLTASGKVRRFLLAHRARDELLGERSQVS